MSLALGYDAGYRKLRSFSLTLIFSFGQIICLSKVIRSVSFISQGSTLLKCLLRAVDAGFSFFKLFLTLSFTPKYPNTSSIHDTQLYGQGRAGQGRSSCHWCRSLAVAGRSLLGLVCTVITDLGA